MAKRLAYPSGSVPFQTVPSISVLLRYGDDGADMPPTAAAASLPDRSLVNALRDARIVRRGFEQAPAAELG